MTGPGLPRLAYSRDEGDPLVDRLATGAANLDIAADDEMFRFSFLQNQGVRGQALVDYFRSASLGCRAFVEVLTWRERHRAAVERVLDFASGYGRTTRFLVDHLAPSKVWVSDIQAGGVEFQRERFGVHGFASCLDPEDLDPQVAFDAIFVLSLFSHLPVAVFSRWLKRLYDLLAPGGSLVFSTLGESSLPAGGRLSAAGYLFSAHSESAVLSREDYGTLYVSPEFVAKSIASLGSEARWRLFPRALWHLQDLYVVVKGAGAPLEDLAVSIGPEGHLEDAQLEDSGALHLSGWVLDHDRPSGRPTIDVQVGNGPVETATAFERRPSVDAALGRSEPAAWGWGVSYSDPAGTLRSTDAVLIQARGARSDFLIHAGTVEGTLLGQKLRVTSRRLEDSTRALEVATESLAAERERSRLLAERLSWMERSRFWKARNSWFEFKRAVKLDPPGGRGR